MTLVLPNHYDHDWHWILHQRLAQGSAPPEHHKRGPFDVIVLCAQDIQPRLPQYPVVIHAGFRDTKRPSSSEIRTAQAAAIETFKRVSAGQRVLITCHAGWNRSGLVTGLTLRHLGMSAKNAIRLIRDMRGPDALHNMVFVRIIEDYEP